MPRPRSLLVAALMATAVLAAPQFLPTEPAATAPPATALGLPDETNPGDMSWNLLTATPSATPPAHHGAPPVIGQHHSPTSVVLSQATLAGIIVACVLGGLLLGLITSAALFICLGRRHVDDGYDSDASASTEKLHRLPIQTPSPAPYPAINVAEMDRLGLTALAPSESVLHMPHPGRPSLPTIPCESLGTPADWEAEQAAQAEERSERRRRSRGFPSVPAHPGATLTPPLGYSDSRPVTPTRFWRGLKDHRASHMTVKSAKTKAKRASIVTVKSMRSGKSHSASIITARSIFSGRSGRSRHSHKDAPPVPPLPFTKRVPVPPLSPGLAAVPPTRPSRPSRRFHMHLIQPDPPAQLD